MSIVSIVGGGSLGGAVAHKLAATGNVQEIRIIDEADAAMGKAIDIQQAGAIERFDTRVIGHRELHAAIGADLVIIAGPADGTEPEYTHRSRSRGLRANGEIGTRYRQRSAREDSTMPSSNGAC